MSDHQIGVESDENLQFFWHTADWAGSDVCQRAIMADRDASQGNVDRGSAAVARSVLNLGRLQAWLWNSIF